jgi:hypothetical protein
MPLWGNEDTANNSPLYATMQFNKAITTANQAELFGNVTANVYTTDQTVGSFAFSDDEMLAAQANGNPHPAHSGWALRTVGFGGRAGRVHYETLVTMSDVVSDSEDTLSPDVVIIVYSQPSSSTANTNDPVNLIVGARTEPAGVTITYKWQRDGGPGAQTWADIANTGLFASANSNNTPTLSVSNNATLSGNVFRVIMTVTGGPTTHSANASITTI